MEEDATVFWDNVKREIHRQNTTHDWVAKKAGISFNTFQGWISKGIFPRVNEAARIAAALDTSVEYLVSGSVADNSRAVNVIFRHLPRLQEHLTAIAEAARELR